MVKVYSLPNCIQCDRTKKILSGAGVSYEEIKIDENESAREHVKSLGYVSAPVVETESDSWAGFRPDKIKKLIEEKTLVLAS